MTNMKPYWNILNLKLYWKHNVDLLIQMYKIIFLCHIEYQTIYNCSGFQISPIKLDKEVHNLAHWAILLVWQWWNESCRFWTKLSITQIFKVGQLRLNIDTPVYM